MLITPLPPILERRASPSLGRMAPGLAAAVGVLLALAAHRFFPAVGYEVVITEARTDGQDNCLLLNVYS